MCACVQAMVFDFDGTLAQLTIDFHHMRQQAEASAIQTVAPAVPPETTFFTPDPALPVLEWLENAHQSVSRHSPALADDMMSAAKQAIVNVEVEAAHRGSLFPWTRTVLRTLQTQGVAPCIITRNCSEAVRTVFPDVEKFCTCLLTRDDVSNVKPHPAHLLRALELANCAPQNAIMVGDHPMDIVTGKAGGTMTAGVLSGHDSHDALKAEKPDFLEQDVHALYETIRDTFWPDAPPLPFVTPKM